MQCYFQIVFQNICVLLLRHLSYYIRIPINFSKLVFLLPIEILKQIVSMLVFHLSVLATSPINSSKLSLPSKSLSIEAKNSSTSSLLDYPSDDDDSEEDDDDDGDDDEELLHLLPEYYLAVDDVAIANANINDIQDDGVTCIWISVRKG